MKKLFLVLLTFSFAACAEFEPHDEPVEPIAPVTVGQSSTVTADDGTEFEVSVVHDGSLTTAQETAVLESVAVSVVSTVRPAGVSVAANDIVPPADIRFNVDDSLPVGIFVTRIDTGTVVDNYRWGWLTEIEIEDVAAFIDTVCPPWH